ncbi:CUB and sushi domain-containing protein 3-like isoform X1 [Lineus longissimus]|uniref:CUB and sushi domain-containing protein 3-like isoform X1 n=1 Tax=Lineus longissimus TaxID=88925 RepID=UPI00315D8AD8
MVALRALSFALVVLVTSGYVAGETFTSPNYPSVYPPGSKVAKSFKFGTGLRPRVALKTLSLAERDSVTIAEGAANGTYCKGWELRRYTGFNQPKQATVFSAGLEVCIAFDGSNGNAEGFEFLIEGIPICNGTYEDVEKSDIISPNYPLYSPIQNNCKWQVIVPPGQHISFKVYSFNLGTSCRNAYLTISNLTEYAGENSKQFCEMDLYNMMMDTLGNSNVVFWSRKEGLGFRIQFTVLGCKKSDLPANATYGKHTNPQALYNENYIAKFHCNDGYRYSNDLDELALTCASDKKWHQVTEAPRPTCIQIQCPRLGGPQYGSVKFDSEAIGSKAIFTCDENFYLVGESVRVCQKEGTWNGTTPVCQFSESIGCQEIGDPTFGKVIGNGSTTNSVLAFECNKGYTLNGPANITCQADGIWSGRLPTCDVVRCPALTAPLNGDIQNVDREYQAVASYTCKSGYRLVNSTDGKRECLETGSWSGPELFCEVITCPIPNVHGGNATYDSLMIGGQANITCDKGHEPMITGYKTAVCLPTGEWSIVILGCFRVRCPRLDNLTNADADWVSHAYGNVVTVECRPGFFFDEYWSVKQKEARCTETKEWSVNVTQGCLFAPVPTSPPVKPVTTTTTTTVTVTPIATQTTTTTPTSPTTSPESTSTSAAIKEGTTSVPSTEWILNTTASETTSSPIKVVTVEPNSTATVTSGRFSTRTPTTDNSHESTTAGVTPTLNFTTKEPRATTTKQLSTAATTDISTVSTGNSTLNTEGNGTNAKQTEGGKDKSGEYIGIGVGCALLVIVLVVVAIWYIRKSNAVPSERLTNDSGAFENQLYDLDSVNVTPGDNERAIDVHQASFNN